LVKKNRLVVILKGSRGGGKGPVVVLKKKEVEMKVMKMIRGGGAKGEYSKNTEGEASKINELKKKQRQKE